MSGLNSPAGLNGMSYYIHQNNRQVGWWDACADWEINARARPIAKDINVLGTKIALIHSEVSEMLEGVRKGIPDDHLPHRSMEEVEAADIVIRLLDYCGARDLDLDGAIKEKMEYNAQRADHTREARAADGGKSI